MCLKLRYCETCLREASHLDLAAYAEGRFHTQPMIEDPNLAWAIQLRRRDVLDEVLSTDIRAAASFPELSNLKQKGSVRHSSVGRLAKLYDRAFGQNQAFAEFAAAQGMTNFAEVGERPSRARRRAQLRHKAAIVAKWIRDHVDDLEALRGFLDPSVPTCMDEVAVYRLKRSTSAADEQIPLAA